MNRNSWLDEVQRNLSDLIARSPAADLQRNAKAMMSDAFSRMDLVTREEFDVQVELLARTRAKLDALEAQLRRLEGQDSAHPASAASSTNPASAMGAFAQSAPASAATTPSAGSVPPPVSSGPSPVSSSSTSTPAGIPSGAGSSGATTPPAGNTGTAPVATPSSSSTSSATPAPNPPKEGDLAM